MPAYGSPGHFAVTSASPSGLAPMQLPKQVRRVGEQGIWSTYSYAAGAALANRTDRIFTTPRGSVGQGFTTILTLPETNMREGGRMPDGEAFDVFGVALQLYYSGAGAITGGDLRNAQANCVLAWDFIQAQIEIGPVSIVGAGGGPFGSTADTGDVQGARANLVNGNGQIWVYRDSPVVLASSTTFGQLLVWGADAQAVDGGEGEDALLMRSILIGRYQTAIPVG